MLFHVFNTQMEETIQKYNTIVKVMYGTWEFDTEYNMENMSFQYVMKYTKQVLVIDLTQ